MARTAALMIPDTPEGRLYRSFDTIANQIAQKTVERLRSQPVTVEGFGLLDAANGTRLGEYAADYLARLIAEYLNSIPFSVVQNLGIAEAIKRLNSIALFTWDANAPRETLDIVIDVNERKQSVALPVIARGEGLYSIHPNFALAYLGAAVDKAGVFGFMNHAGGRAYAQYREGMGIVFSQGVIDAMKGALGLLVNSMQYGGRFDQVYVMWWDDPVFYDFVPVYGVEAQENALVTVVDHIEARLKDGYSLSTASPWVCQPGNHPVALVKAFADMGKQLNDARVKADRARLFKVIAVAAAIVGGIAAIESISTVGANVSNVAKLVGSIDNLPGVDLGPVGKIASGFTSGEKLASTIPGATMFEVGDFDVIDPGSFDVGLTFEDIGANVIDLDLSMFQDLGLEMTDLLTDEFGNIFTVTGEAVSLSPEAYVKSIYIDDTGNFRDFTNNVVMTQAEADASFNERGLDEDVANKLAERVRSFSGASFVAGEGNINRPDGTPAAAEKGQLPFLQQISQEALNWFKSITQYSLAREQLQKTGRYTPPYQTNPSGTPYSQVPGVPIRRADGSQVINNGNGTQTVVTPDKRVTTTPTSVNPAGFYNSQFGGAQLLPGINNQTLLIAGAGLLAVLLLSRRS